MIKLALHTALTFILISVSAISTQAQNLFEPVITVNDQVITRFELQQRARLLTVFRAPGDSNQLAREQLIEDRLKIDAANLNGIVIQDDAIRAGMEEFASRANFTADQLISLLGNAGVEPQTFREFVRSGITWRELIRARFSSQISVSEDDLARAQTAVSRDSGVRVLLSEIIMPAPNPNDPNIQNRARRIAASQSEAEFSQFARQFSASATRGRGGRLQWMPLNNLPAPLRPVILGLGLGDVTDPIPTQGAIALFQLRDIEETDTGAPEYSAIEYAAYYIAGGRSSQALEQAARIRANVDTCDDLYGIAQGQPAEVLERGSKSPDEIPQDIAIELAKLDPGEVSTALTRSNGQTLVFLMLCGRSTAFGEDGPSEDQLSGFIRNQRLESFANGYLEQLKAEARMRSQE